MAVRAPAKCDCGREVEFYGGEWVIAKDGTVLPPVLRVVDAGTTQGHECDSWGYASARRMGAS